MRLEDVLRSVVKDVIVEFRAKVREIEEESLRRLREGAMDLSRQAAASSQAIRRESDALRQRLISQAMLEAKKEYLESIEECVQEVINEALNRIKSMRSSEDYRRSLKALLREAVEAVGGDEIVVESAPDDEKLVKELAAELSRAMGLRIKLSERRLESIGGVRVLRGDGASIYDNTIEARLDRLREEIRSELIKRLLSS